MIFRFAVVPAVIFAFLALASPAFAAATISPTTAVKGDTTVLSFRVTNVQPTATIDRVDIELPADNGFTSVTVEPHAGWSYVFSRTNDKTTGIVWTSTTNGALKPGEFDQFNVNLGPLPADADTVSFKVVQAYSDGTTESPQLSIKLNPSEAAATNPLQQQSAIPVGSDSDRTNAALAIGLVALTLSVAALLIALFTRLGSRR